MRKFLLIVFMPAMMGCATAWQGKPAMELIGALGIPTRQMELPEGTALEYVKCNSIGMQTPIGNTLLTSSGSCSRQVFIVKDHVVVQAFRKTWE